MTKNKKKNRLIQKKRKIIELVPMYSSIFTMLISR